MKYIILLFTLISITLTARTQAESKDRLKSFASSHTSSSSSSNEKKKDDDDDDNDNDDDQKDNRKSYNHGAYSNDPIILDSLWFWQPEYSNIILDPQKEQKLFYISSSYNFQHWTPTGINNAKTDTTELSFVKFEISALYNLIYFDYETSFYGVNLAQQRELLKIRKNLHHGWERYLGEVTLPIIIMWNKTPFLRIYFGYDQQVFISTITSLEKKYYSPREDANKGDNHELIEINKGDKIVTSTLFQDYFLGVKNDFNPNFKFYTGIFFMIYNKPYSLTIDGAQYDEEIHDTDFSAIGVYANIASNIDLIDLKLGVKIGSGEIKFVAINTTVKDLVSKDYNTVYFQFNGDIGIHYNITKKIKLEAKAKIEYRKFSLSKPDSNEDDNKDDSESLELNTDTIFTAYAGVSYSF